MSIVVSLISFIWRYKVPIGFALLLFVIWIKGQEIKHKALEYAQAVENYTVAVNANATNQKTIQSLQQDMELERQAIAAELDRQKTLNDQFDQMLKELENAPGAKDRVNPYFDSLGDKLRSNPKGSGADTGRVSPAS